MWVSLIEDVIKSPPATTNTYHRGSKCVVKFRQSFCEFTKDEIMTMIFFCNRFKSSPHSPRSSMLYCYSVSCITLRWSVSPPKTTLETRLDVPTGLSKSGGFLRTAAFERLFIDNALTWRTVTLLWNFGGHCFIWVLSIQILADPFRTVPVLTLPYEKMAVPLSIEAPKVDCYVANPANDNCNYTSPFRSPWAVNKLVLLFCFLCILMLSSVY